MIKHFEGEYRFLSNFYMSVVNYDGWQYASVEHAYQAAKSMDDNVRMLFRADITPGAAKKMGRSIILLRPDWNNVRDHIMKVLVTDKFRNPELRDKLLATGTQELEEGNNWHDCYWGVCYCTRCGGIGDNTLGKTLMAVRSELCQTSTLSPGVPSTAPSV